MDKRHFELVEAMQKGKTVRLTGGKSEKKQTSEGRG